MSPFTILKLASSIKDIFWDTPVVLMSRKTTDPAPLLIASIPKEPVPQQRSSTFLAVISPRIENMALRSLSVVGLMVEFLGYNI